MKSDRERIIFVLHIIRCFPHLLLFLIHRNRSVIKADIVNGLKLHKKHYNSIKGLIYLLTFEQAFRNIFYKRVAPFDFFLSVFCPPMSSLIIRTNKIGEGFSISHGMSSAIGPVSIGKNCTIFQQVTIGAATKFGSPVIKDNVIIYAGAVIIGNVTIGNNVTIGANSTVYMNVPDNSTVLPGTSKIMRWSNNKAD